MIYEILGKLFASVALTGLTLLLIWAIAIYAHLSIEDNNYFVPNLLIIALGIILSIKLIWV